MRFGKVLRKTVLVLLAAVLMMQIPALALSSSEAFSDVPSDAWYKASLDKLILEVQKRLIALRKKKQKETA